MYSFPELIPGSLSTNFSDLTAISRIGKGVSSVIDKYQTPVGQYVAIKSIIPSSDGITDTTEKEIHCL